MKRPFCVAVWLLLSCGLAIDLPAAAGAEDECERRIGKIHEADADRRRIRELAPEQK